jgi:quercetin dioxygenase-like cupin family protein
MMTGKFLTADQVTQLRPSAGIEIGLISGPASGGKNIVVNEVIWNQGRGHPFHKHPNQEEVIYILEGTLEQWIEREKKVLRHGEGALIPPDTVHAAYQTGDTKARFLAILGPCVGERGYEAVDFSDREPWKSIR